MIFLFQEMRGNILNSTIWMIPRAENIGRIYFLFFSFFFFHWIRKFNLFFFNVFVSPRFAEMKYNIIPLERIRFRSFSFLSFVLEFYEKRYSVPMRYFLIVYRCAELFFIRNLNGRIVKIDWEIDFVIFFNWYITMY